MEIGVPLTNEDLQAIKKLFRVRWSADIRNWKERDVEGCLWIVTAPDKAGNWIIERGQSLEQTINPLLKSIEVEQET